MEQQGSPEAFGRLDHAEQAAWLVAHKAVLVAAVVDAVASRVAGHARPAPWLGALPGHVRHLLGSLAAALVADDGSILVETGEWLAEALDRDGAGETVLAEAWSALGETLPGGSSGWLLLARTVPGCVAAEVSA